jgi:hypothetical protein
MMMGPWQTLPAPPQSAPATASAWDGNPHQQ